MTNSFLLTWNLWKCSTLKHTHTDMSRTYDDDNDNDITNMTTRSLHIHNNVATGAMKNNEKNSSKKAWSWRILNKKKPAKRKILWEISFNIFFKIISLPISTNLSTIFTANTYQFYVLLDYLLCMKNNMAKFYVCISLMTKYFIPFFFVCCIKKFLFILH